MDKEKKYIIGVSILVVALITIGISYAYWMLSFTQEEKNVVVLDCFNITFTGENDINLTNAYPMQDDELYTFYQSAKPYHFTITNICESNASGVINLETLSTTKKIADDYINVILYEGTKNYLDIAKASSESTDVYSLKGEGRIYNDINIYDYSLKNNPVNSEKVITDAITGYKLHEFTLGPLESKEYNLLEYMSPDTPPIDEVMDATFESKITVSARYRESIDKMNLLKARNCASADSCTDTTRVFQTDYINNATSIVFEKNAEAPTTYTARFDESEAQDGSVMAYVVANESDTNTYTIKFQTDGIFLMPEDSSGYFSYFSKVVSIEGLENVNTSIVTDMSGMFSNMNKLTNLDLSYFDTSNVTNMTSMFSSCSSLTSLDVSYFDTSNVTNMVAMFNGMRSLTSLDIKHFNWSSATDMMAMFAGCSGLTSLDLSGINVSNVTNMSHMFRSCSGLISLNLSGIDASNLINVESMFSGCSNLKSLDLSNFNANKLTNMKYMFNELTNLTTLNLSNFNASNVTDMSLLFAGLSKLTDLNLNNFNTSKVINMSAMFAGMSSLKRLNLSSFDTSNVTNMGSMFASTTNLTSITYGPNFVRKSGSNISSMFGGSPANKPVTSSWQGAF